MLSFFKNKFSILISILLVGFFLFVREDIKKDDSASPAYNGNMVKFFAAEFTGEDENGKEYRLKAKEARNVENDKYLLSFVEMSYDFEGECDLKLVSNKGSYDKKKQIFTSEDDVKMSLQNQYFMYTKKLYANLANRLIYTDEKVEVEGGGIFVRSTHGVNVDTKKKVIDYHGPIYSKFADF